MSAPPDPTSTAPTYDVHLLFGPMLIGVFFNLILFGVLIAQVWSIFFIEVVNTAFDMSYMYEPLILHYGAFPDNLPTVFMTQPLCIVLVGFPIQLFFIWRIRKLTGNKILPVIITLCALTAVGGGLATSVRVPATAKFSNIPHLYQSAEVWLIAEAVTDLLIAGTLSIALGTEAEAPSVVDKIIRMTVQTGMLTALFSILDMVSFLTVTDATLNFMWNIPISKLYFNCLMSTLNARHDLNRGMNGDTGSRSEENGGSGPTYVTNGNTSKGLESLRPMSFAWDQTIPGESEETELGTIKTMANVRFPKFI
ncbi:hypothetical protein C8R43DRAFT_1195004 [Mycena crocata]|nr:hypothetical protein C8R43DRAFT_1195004 [Mycena crocata]